MARQEPASGAASRPVSSRDRRLALAVLTALNLLNYLDRYLLAGVVPLVKAEFHCSDAALGALTTAFFAVYMVSAPACGWLGDRMPRRPLIAAGAILWSLLTLLTGWVHSYSGLYLRHALVGVGEASFGVLAPAMIAAYYRDHDRNRILSLFYVAIPVGSALGYVTGGSLGARFGWRVPFLLAAVPGLLLGGLMLAVREPGPAAGRGSPGAEETGREAGVPLLGSLRRLAVNRAFLGSTLGMAMLVFAMGGISVWMPTFLTRQAGMSLTRANWLLGAATVVDGIAATALGGWLAERRLRGDHRALYRIPAWSALAAVPFCALAIFGPAPTLPASLFAGIFLLLLHTGPLNTAIVNSVPASMRARAVAVNLFLIHALGDALSAPLIGRISDRSGLRVGLASTLAALVLSAAALFWGARFAPRLEGRIT